VTRLSALGVAAALAGAIVAAVAADRREDTAADPVAVLRRTVEGVQWDETVARAWPEIGTRAKDAAAQGRRMEPAFGGSDRLAKIASELAQLERRRLRVLLQRESALRTQQGTAGRVRARQLGKRAWWLTTWCDDAWQQNQMALLASAHALTSHYGYAFSDRPSAAYALRALVHCRRAVRFSIAAPDPSATRERGRRNWFIPVAETTATLVRRTRAVEPADAQQRRWHRALVAAANADARWLRFVARIQQGGVTEAERRREASKWLGRDTEFSRATGDALRPDR
jgi:hypothetical protein